MACVNMCRLYCPLAHVICCGHCVVSAIGVVNVVGVYKGMAGMVGVEGVVGIWVWCG